MIKIFDIPIYALSEKDLNQRVSTKREAIENSSIGAERDIINNLIERSTFPMRIWDYNHIIGHIQIGLSAQDIVARIFLPTPIPARYHWNSDKKYFVHDIFANNAHVYIGNKKTNKEFRSAASTLLRQTIADHLPSRFYADTAAFDAINMHLDYLKLLQNN